MATTPRAWSAIALRAALCAFVVAGGCSRLPKPPAELKLAAPQMSPEAVALDIFFVRIAADDPEAAGPLWTTVDEQGIAPELRAAWYANGLRAGVITGPLPPALERWMKLSERPAATAGEAQEFDVKEEPRVRQRHLQLPRGQRGEIVASDVYETLPVLIADGQEVRGQNYNRAQCLFEIRSEPRDDRTAELTLVPQIQYGDPRQRFAGADGAFWLDSGRPRRDFEELRLTQRLSPGQFLLIGRVPDRAGSLGHHFLCAGTEQKLIVVRLSQMGDVDLFGPGDAAPLADVDRDPPRAGEEIAATALVELPDEPDEDHGAK